MLRRRSFLLAAVVLLLISCKKNNASRTTCTSTLYGEKYSYSPSFPFGVINQSTGGLLTLSTLTYATWDGYNDNAAYNTLTNSYYRFIHSAYDTGYSADTLLKISPTGTVTYLLKATTDSVIYRDMIYNQFNDKLYCVKGRRLSELTISGSTFTATPVAADSIIDISAVDNATGDMYFTVYTSSAQTLHKYHPGASSSTAVATSPGTVLFGLCYNSSDHKLYGIKYETTFGNDFIRIDPATGSVTTLATLSFFVDYKHHSAVIDPCTNQYVISSRDTMEDPFASSYLRRINMSGAVVQHNAIAGGTYFGLAIR